MTDGEIMKALECCLSDIPPCITCKYDNDTITCDECMGELMKDALDLINRQKAEIEGLKEFIEKDQGLILKLTNVPKDEYDNKIKTEAIKEFAERLKSVYKNHLVCSFNVINNEMDNLVKEMVGDNE